MFKSIAPFISRSSIVNDRMISSVQEHIYGIREIHLGNRFSSQEEEYNKLNKLNAHYNFKVKSAMCLFSPGTSTLIYSLTVAIYVSGAFLIKNEEQVRQMADFSSMVSFVSFIAFIFTALIDIVLVLLAIPSLLNSQNRILEVLNTKNSIVDGAYQGQPAEHGTVEFDQVSFAYPGSDKYAIEDISFRIQSGQTVAFIGGTGAGKTTVLNLMLRLYEAAEGEILVDGIPVRDYRLKELRNLMGYVPQQNYLFTGTIAGNIGYGENGRFQAALEEIQKAAVVGQADSFIREKQGGYYGQVYAGGSNFSGGQRQRLTISRAICRDPEIYIFDDSFSALDFETDAKLRKALKKTTKGATVIIVAQRISSVRDADRIIVMDSGRIVDQGTHEELLARCRIYQEIASSQNPEEKAV
jgi:ATP-binding cassette subfamily B protein